MKKSYILLLSAILLMAFNTVYSQSPVISSFSPASGPVGSSVTITGSGFSTTLANNAVLFGTIRATVTAASATQLTFLVPVGTSYGPFTVINKATGLSVTANRVFKITYSTTFNIAAPQPFTPIVDPWAFEVGDVDGDGMPDVVVGNYTGEVYVHRNTTSPGSSQATYAAPTLYGTLAELAALQIADVNGDGKADIVTRHKSVISVLRNTSTIGNVSFAVNVEVPIGQSINYGQESSLNVDDIDGDGRPDLAFTHGGFVRLMRNTSAASAISFSTALSAPQLSNYDLKLADLDGDGKKDIIVSSKVNSQMYIARNTATPGRINASSFATPVAIPAITFGIINVADIDGDNKIDIILNNVIYRNASIPGVLNSSSFEAPLVFKREQGGSNLISDVTGDGKPDMVRTENYEVVVYTNVGTPGHLDYSSFGATIFPISLNPSFGAVALADINGDGKQDLITSSTILLNDAEVFKKPVINSFSPVSANAGATVTISGKNFNATPENNIVYFGAVRANVTGASATQITVTVPTGATYEPISVLNKALNRTGISKLPFVLANTKKRPKILKTDFDAPVILAIPSGPLYFEPQVTAIKDINGDGKPDIISANTSGLSIYQNNAAGGALTAAMFNRVDFSIPSVLGFAVGDLDNDGKPDIAVAGGATLKNMYVTVLRNISAGGNISAGSFESAGSKAIPGTPSGPTQNTTAFANVHIADIDNDGVPDIIVNGNGGYSFRNTSTPGNMTTSTLFGQAGARLGLELLQFADFDLDGRIDYTSVRRDPWGDVPNRADLAINSSRQGVINADSFRGQEYGISFTGAPNMVTVGDINGDGRLDAVATLHQGMELALGEKTGDLVHFPSYGIISFSHQSLSTALGDINGDGKLDIINSPHGDIYTNNYSSGTLSPASFTVEESVFSGFSGPTEVKIADMDGDGIPDLIGTNTLEIKIKRYNPTVLGAAMAADITVTSAVSPNGDGVNDVFTINGIDKYPDNKVMITNSRGARVFEVAGYDNNGKAFNGVSASGIRQQGGTYFYSVDYTDKGVRKSKSGYLLLKY